MFHLIRDLTRTISEFEIVTSLKSDVHVLRSFHIKMEIFVSIFLGWTVVTSNPIIKSLATNRSLEIRCAVRGQHSKIKFYCYNPLGREWGYGTMPAKRHQASLSPVHCSDCSVLRNKMLARCYYSRSINSK